jgi:formate hydrogenlyase subunit 6/NADH:ubiquinone oxidoreductase subunit I
MNKPGKMVVEVLRNAMRDAATTTYPAVKLVMPDKFRGEIKFTSEKCIGCKACERDCPSNAIHITKVADKMFQADIDLDKCIYCAQCVDSCPKDALESSDNFELAQLDRSKFRITYHAVAKKTESTPAAKEPEKKSV